MVEHFEVSTSWVLKLCLHKGWEEEKLRRLVQYDQCNNLKKGAKKKKLCSRLGKRPPSLGFRTCSSLLEELQPSSLNFPSNVSSAF